MICDWMKPEDRQRLQVMEKRPHFVQGAVDFVLGK
jgi:hypothetical protein